MRLLLVSALVALAATSAAATITTTPTGKNNAVACRTPIAQVSCKVAPNGMLDGFWFGAWPSPPDGAAGPAPFIPGPSGLWYTQTWCNGWGQRPVCVNGASGSNLLPDASWDASTQSATSTGTATIPYVTGIQICYGKHQVRGITFTSSNFATSWTFAPGNPPQAVVTAAGGETTSSCGLTDNCLWTQSFDAPDGQVLGAIEGKCKYTQGWFKYVQNGQYRNKYFLKKVEKVCVLDPVPFPIGAFVPCAGPECTGPLGPNNPACSDVSTYACPGCAAKK